MPPSHHPGIPPDDSRQEANITQFMDCSKAPIRSVVDYDIREHNFVMTVIGGKLVHGPYRSWAATMSDDGGCARRLKDIYDVFYRGLSNDSSHPSITALNRHVESNHAGLVTGLKWGPDVNDVRYMLSAACTAGVYLVSFAIEIFKQNEIRVAFESCWPTYKRLVEEQQRQAMAGGLQ
jgi:hypothetical protein